jgi:hypothetical protein
MEVRYYCLLDIKQTHTPVLVLDDKINKLVTHSNIEQCQFVLNEEIIKAHIGIYYEDHSLHYYWLLTDGDMSYSDGAYNIIVYFNHVSTFDYIYYLG